MKIITAGNISKDIAVSLTDMGFEVCYTCEDANLLDGLKFHPDMQMSKIGSYVICNPDMYNHLKKILENTSYKLVCGKKQTRCNYPNDVAYNIKVAGENVFHNFKYTDDILKEKLEHKNKINVSQGYSGCSICYIGDNALITADTVIYSSAIQNGIDALLISAGNIALPGFDYGFIGGASFYLDSTVYFFGNIQNHPEYAKINEFCTKHNTKLCSLSKEELTDYGSAVTLD